VLSCCTFLNRGTSSPGPPDTRLRAKRYGETSPKHEERRRALARGDPEAPLRSRGSLAALAGNPNDSPI